MGNESGGVWDCPGRDGVSFFSDIRSSLQHLLRKMTSFPTWNEYIFIAFSFRRSRIRGLEREKLRDQELQLAVELLCVGWGREGLCWGRDERPVELRQDFFKITEATKHLVSALKYLFLNSTVLYILYSSVSLIPCQFIFKYLVPKTKCFSQESLQVATT